MVYPASSLHHCGHHLLRGHYVLMKTIGEGTFGKARTLGVEWVHVLPGGERQFRGNEFVPILAGLGL